MNARNSVPPAHSALAEVALIDARTCAAAGSMSVSWWHDSVRCGRAPRPVIQLPRCTRWKLEAVREFWREYAATAAVNAEATARVIGNATKASRMAREPAALAKAQATRAANKLAQAQGRQGVPA